VLLIENVPVSTEAPSRISLMAVKFSLPWRTCTIGFLAGVAGLFPAPRFCGLGLICLGLGHSLM
jgi:hypothetical protein